MILFLILLNIFFLNILNKTFIYLFLNLLGTNEIIGNNSLLICCFIQMD